MMGFIRGFLAKAQEISRLNNLATTDHSDVVSYFSERNYSGEPELFDLAIKCGILPNEFNALYARFRVMNPRADFLSTLSSLSGIEGQVERTARAVDLFGRGGEQLLLLLPVEKRHA